MRKSGLLKIPPARFPNTDATRKEKLDTKPKIEKKRPALRCRSKMTNKIAIVNGRSLTENVCLRTSELVRVCRVS